MAEAPAEPPRASEPAAGSPPIVELVFQDREDGPRRRIVGAAAITVALYGSAAGLLSIRSSCLGPSSAERAAEIHARLANERVVELMPAPPPPPPAESPPPPAPSVANPPLLRTAGRTVHRSSSSVVAPAQAAAVLTRTAPASAVDLTGDTFATGGAASFPGGATAGAGRSTAPVTGAVDVHAPPARRPTAAGPHQARAVTLAEGTWGCPWPAEADAEQIDEQTVVIRVRVRADGTVERAEIVSDPGHGFGRAATACARRTRFQAARDGDGAVIDSWSPPIRVHFWR